MPLSKSLICAVGKNRNIGGVNIMTDHYYDDVIPEMKYFICRYCRPSWCLDDYTHHYVDLTYVFEGKARYIINGVPYDVRKGDLICIPSGSRRQANIDSDDPMAAYASNFHLYHLRAAEASLPFPIHSTIGIHDDLLSLYQELNFEWVQKKAGYIMKVRAIFLNILHRLFSILYYKDNSTHIDARIQIILDYMSKNYSLPLDVKQMASIVDLNPSYFGTLFSREIGITVKEYLNRIKINSAENMLVSGEFTITEAAHRCGFEDPFYFSKVFKKIKGYPPSKVILKRV